MCGALNTRCCISTSRGSYSNLHIRRHAHYVFSQALRVLGLVRTVTFLTSFAVFPKATVRFLHVPPSSRKEELGSHWTDFHEIWYLRIFRKCIKKIQVSLTSDKNSGYFTWRLIYVCDHISYFFLEWEMFQTKVVDKIKTHILCSIHCFFHKSFHLWDNVKKYGRYAQATDDNMAHAHCVLN
jgi:hypothetical protein